MDPKSLFSRSDHLERLGQDGDPLEVLDATVDNARLPRNQINRRPYVLIHPVVFRGLSRNRRIAFALKSGERNSC